jgi:hypothetical protein
MADSVSSPLDLGTNDDVLALLDAMLDQGGSATVVEWAQKELRPDREIRCDGRRGIIVDRSVWSVDKSGQLGHHALLAPLTDEQYGRSEVFSVWSRPQAKEPVLVRVRTLVAPKEESAHP